MNRKEIKDLLKEAKTINERQELLDKLEKEFPDITIKECIDLGFSYEEIIF